MTMIAVPKSLSYRWPLIAIGLLATHFTVMILAVIFFVRHNTNDVIPNYYDKAVHWDDFKAARQKMVLEQQKLDVEAAKPQVLP